MQKNNPAHVCPACGSNMIFAKKREKKYKCIKCGNLFEIGSGEFQIAWIEKEEEDKPKEEKRVNKKEVETPVMETALSENRKLLLLNVQDKIKEFLEKAKTARGFEFTFQKQRQLNFLNKISEMEIKGERVTTKSISTEMNIPYLAAQKLLKTARDDKIIIQKKDPENYLRSHVFNDEYLAFLQCTSM